MFFPPLPLQLFVLPRGVVMLLLESFSEKGDRTQFAWLGIGGLAIMFIVVQSFSPGASGMNSSVIYSSALFFKKFSLLTTIVVLIMSIDYSEVIQRFVPGRSPQ